MRPYLSKFGFMLTVFLKAEKANIENLKNQPLIDIHIIESSKNTYFLRLHEHYIHMK